MAADRPDLTPDESRERWKGNPEVGPSRPPPLPGARSAQSAAPDTPVPMAEKVDVSPPAETPFPETDLPPAATDGQTEPDGAGDSDEFEDFEESRWHVRRGSLRGAISFFASMLVHLGLLLGLAMFVLPEKETTRVRTMVIDVTDEIARELETVELDQRDEAATTISRMMSSGDPIAGPQSAQFRAAERVEIDTSMVDQLQSSADAGDIEIDGLLDMDFSREEILQELPDGAVGEARAVVDGYGEAFDRITQEVESMLYGGPVLLIWCFDLSNSMKDDQEEIRQRIDRVYAELDLVSHASGGALKSAVTAFGQGLSIVTPEPLHDPAKIRNAINSLPTDPSGKEFMCQAVARSISAFEDYARRQRRRMAFILVTDESGERPDNVAHLEATIEVARAARCRVYVLGREAVFGYPYVRFRHKHRQTQRIHWLLADRGPETAFVEQLQTNGFHRRHDAFASGFGSYEQSRLARQTGGIFFLLPSVEASIVRGGKRRYELEAMRHYRPDLRARQEIIFDRDQSPLRLMLWKIIYDLDPHNKQAKDITEVRVHYSPDPTTFAQQVTTQIPRARIYLGYLAAAIDVLKANRALRDQEHDIRWRANYDLMLGQLIAYQARLYEYGAYLEHFVRNPQVVALTKPPDLRLTHWDITTRRETMTGEVIEPYVKKATALLDAVVEDYAGTPWAERAKWELRRGYGVRLHPVYEPPYVTVSNPEPLPKL
jgi:hypothetical protein